MTHHPAASSLSLLHAIEAEVCIPHLTREKYVVQFIYGFVQNVVGQVWCMYVNLWRLFAGVALDRKPNSQLESRSCILRRHPRDKRSLTVIDDAVISKYGTQCAQLLLE